MSDGKEVRRWNINLGDHEEGLYEIESSNGEWIKAYDHDRIVAELRAEVEARRKLDIVTALNSVLDKKNETIATQARVIEKLRNFVNARGHHEDCMDGNETFSENETCECGFSELAAIEKEGAKDE